MKDKTLKILDQTALNIGDKAKLGANYSGDLLKSGDEVEIIGKKTQKDEACYTSFIVGNEYFHKNESVLSVCYQIKTYSPLTGEIVPHSVFCEELVGGYKGPNLFADANDFKKNSKLCKKLYKICLACGEIGLAKMFLHARHLRAVDLLDVRADNLASKREAKKKIAEKVSKVIAGEIKVA